MKTLFKYTYLMVLAAVSVVMVACSSDSISTEQPTPTDAADLLQLRIATNATTRARTTAWVDVNAQDEEMMNIWVVVITNTSDGSVVKCIACRPSAGSEREIDEVGRFTKGAYTVYSFANISVANVCTLLGLTAPSTIPTIGSIPVEIAVTGSVNAEAVADQTATINGNKFDPTTTNNYGEIGIPMSNVQIIADTEAAKNLIVIRMLAKIELQIFNDSGNEIAIESVTLTDVTINAAANLKLLPSLSADGHNMMEVTTHGDIQPNLGTVTTEDVTVDYSTNVVISASGHKSTDGTLNPVKLTFYVNESATPQNELQHFFLKLKLANETEQRYALIDDKGKTTADNNKWNYIARNDYRVIPIVLDDYKFDIIPYDFPAIGVYPASVKEEDGLYTINFHDYGHFHLVPVMKKTSTDGIVSFTATAPSGTYSSDSWGFVTDGSFASSWSSWTDVTKTIEYDNATANPAFYRTGEAANITTNIDGDEVGGVPVWYPNTSSPQWDPAGGTTYRPFIFGYIADPGQTLTEDRKVYHEFTINLYKQGMSIPRVMTYRLLMKLDTSQMMYARGASR